MKCERELKMKYDVSYLHLTLEISNLWWVRCTPVDTPEEGEQRLKSR